jgi:hypothetical protein
MLILADRMRSFSAESPRFNSDDHKAAIQEAAERYHSYKAAYQRHKDHMAPEVMALAAKHNKTPAQAAKYHAGYPALKTLLHLKSTAELDHKQALADYEKYKERKLLKKRE